MRLRLPGSTRLTPVGISECEVHAGNLLVLEQHADHLADAEVRAEGQLADARAVVVGMAVVPELALEVFPRAGDADQTPARDLEPHRRRAQITVLRVEIVAGGAVADED